MLNNLMQTPEGSREREDTAMENIVEKINEQRIEDAARKLDELPPVIRARVLGFIEGAVSILQEKKAG